MGSQLPGTMLRTGLFLCVLITLAACGLFPGQAALRRMKRREQTHTDMAHCRNGALRNCTCTDGSVANMFSNPCPTGSNVDQNTCECPEGYDTITPPGRAHRLHKICSKDGVTSRSTCKCSNGANADWTKHPCANGNYIEKCVCPKAD